MLILRLPIHINWIDGYNRLHILPWEKELEV